MSHIPMGDTAELVSPPYPTSWDPVTSGNVQDTASTGPGTLPPGTWRDTFP